MIGLYGVWGSGKSSVKNMVIEALNEGKAERIEVAEFNSWQFANREKLTAAFFDQIGIALGRADVASKEARGRLLRKWRRYAAYLRAGSGVVDIVRKPFMWAAGLMALFFLGFAVGEAQWFAGLVALALVGLAALLKFSSSVAEKVAGFLEVGVETGRKTVEEVKAELAAELKDLRTPILVVIDDVDRLTPQEIQELFQLIKANADFPNLVYLVLFERTTVEKSVTKVLEVDGREYLEKIVQVGFDLPRASRTQIDRVLFEGLAEILGSDENIGRRFDKHRWGNLYLGALQPYFETLRDVNRYLSTLGFHFSLFQVEGAFEVNPVDLIGLEVLRMFEPDVYHALPGAKELLTQQRDAREEAEERRRAIQAIVELAPEQRRERVREIVRQLFPSAAWAFGGPGYGGDIAERWFRDLQVCSAERFDRYFGLAVPEGDVPQATIERLLALAGDRAELRTELRALGTQGLLDTVMTRLDSYKEEISLEHARQFVPAMFDIGEQLPKERDGMFEIPPWMHPCRIVYWYLRREKNLEARLAILREAIEATDGLSVPLRFVALEEQAAQKQGEGREVLVTDAGLQELKALCVQKIERAAEQGRLRGNPDLRSILYRWKDWAGEAAPRALCQKIATTREGALALVTGFLLRSTSHGFGDHVGREHWFIRLGDLELFIPWETVERSLEGVEVEALGQRERTAIETFRKAARRRRQGKPDMGDIRHWDDDDD